MTKLTWVWSPISKFGDIFFIDTVTCINHWKFQGNHSVGVALTSIQSLYEVRSLDVTRRPDLVWPGSESFTTYAEKMYDKVCQKRLRCGPLFSGNLKKTEGVLNNPPLGRRLEQKWLHILPFLVGIGSVLLNRNWRPPKSKLAPSPLQVPPKLYPGCASARASSSLLTQGKIHPQWSTFASPVKKWFFS